MLSRHGEPEVSAASGQLARYITSQNPLNMSVTVCLHRIIALQYFCSSTFYAMMLITASTVTYHTRRPQGRAFLRSSTPNRRELPRPLRMRRIQQHPIPSPHSGIHGPGWRHLSRARRASNEYEANAQFRDPERRHIDQPPGSNEPRNPPPVTAT